MKALTIFYDPDCGLCCAFRAWLLGQETRGIYLEFEPYTSDLGDRLIPGFRQLDPGKEIIVLADDGRYWQGPDAWIICLWTLRKYRKYAKLLNAPGFKHLTRSVCYALSENRLKISEILRMKGMEP